MRILIRETVYGGKIDSDFDQQVLDSFVNSLFTPECYESSFSLVSASGTDEKLLIPEGTKMSHFIDWVRKLPEQQPPHWLGLPRNAEKLLIASRGRVMLSKVRKMNSLDEQDEHVSTKSEAQTSSLPAWMRSLLTSTERWIALLPESLASFSKDDQGLSSPYYRFFEREYDIATNLLKQVRRDLLQIGLLCKGEVKQTNLLRSLVGSLTKGGFPNNTGMVPKEWIKYKIPRETSADQWMSDFSKRLAQIDSVCTTSSVQAPQNIWIGGLFMPEAFITASRQTVAQRNSWSLEELTLILDFGSSIGENEFSVAGLRVEGADFVGGSLVISDSTSFKLDCASIKWIKKESKGAVVSLPVYLNSDRTDVLFVAEMDKERIGKVGLATLVQRGVAFVASF